MRAALVAITLSACSGSSPPVSSPHVTPAAPCAVATDPAHQTPRQRIEGTWSLEKWFVEDKVLLPPDIGGVLSFHDGIAMFQINLPVAQSYIFCIGYYKFSDNDTVLSIGWNRCSKWAVEADGIHSDFTDEWDDQKPVMKIETLPGGELSLKYNTNNEHPHVVKHGAIGQDYTFKLDETLEYWNVRKTPDGKKDNIKYFKKLHEGDPNKHF